MTSNVMALMKKNELMSEISKKLLALEENAVKDETKDNIKKIAREISNLQNVELWEEFDSRFKQVHSDFYKKLNHKFPDLSPVEQRICAFLKMNMSTKDIAELTGKQILSINNARSRIRTKLGLSPDDNLVSYLTKI
jgi:DNA-binding CsgD family transcriptional regulator